MTDPGRTGAVNEACGRAVVDELSRLGVTDAFLSPGSRSTPLALAFASDDRIRLHVLIDERSSAFAAVGAGKASGVPAAVVSTSGTAAANFFPAVIEASLSRTPLLVLTADRPPEARGTGANQTIDQLHLFGNSIRWFSDLAVPEPFSTAGAYWRGLICKAFGETTNQHPGPVHLNFPFREPLMPSDAEPEYEASGRSEGEPWIRYQVPPQEPDEEVLSGLAARIRSAARGMIFAGSSFADPKAVVDLATAAGWPLLADPFSGARWGPNAISVYDSLLRDTDTAGRLMPDFVVQIGANGSSNALRTVIGAVEEFVILDSRAAWHDSAKYSGQLIEGDATAICVALVKSLEQREGGEWLQAWQSSERQARSAVDSVLDSDPGAIEPRIARDLAESLPQGVGLVIGSSMPVRDLEWFARPGTNWPVFGNRGASGIDGFVSTAAGVAVVRSQPTVALCGDLSFLHDQNGLMFAAQENVPIAFVVINNQGGGVFEFLPQSASRHFERVFATPPGIELKSVASVYGLTHAMFTEPSDLLTALERWYEAPAPVVFEVASDRKANHAAHSAIFEAVAGITAQ